MEIDQFNVVKVNVLPFFGQAGVICATEKTARGGAPKIGKLRKCIFHPS